MQVIIHNIEAVSREIATRVNKLIFTMTGETVNADLIRQTVANTLTSQARSAATHQQTEG